jgi:hypothetical protein
MVPAALALAAMLSGCVVFKGPIKAKQIGHKNKVKVTFALCNSDDGTDTICPGLGNSEDPGMTSGVGFGERLLLGFRVPKGTKLPGKIRARDADVRGEFTRFADYGQRLNEEAPKRRKYKWVGYQSTAVCDVEQCDGDPDDGGADPYRYEDARFKVKMGLPPNFHGERFKFRPVVGWYTADDPPTPLVCGPALYDRVSDAEGGDRVCIDSPSPEKVRKSIKVKIDR